MSIDIRGICRTYSSDNSYEIMTNNMLAINKKNAGEICSVLKDLFSYVDENKIHIKSDEKHQGSFVTYLADIHRKAQDAASGGSSFFIYDSGVITKAQALLAERYIEDPTVHELKKYLKYKLQDDLGI